MTCLKLKHAASGLGDARHLEMPLPRQIFVQADDHQGTAVTTPLINKNE